MMNASDNTNLRVHKPGLLLFVFLLAVFNVKSQTCDPFTYPELFGQAGPAIYCKGVPVGFGVSNSVPGQLYNFGVYTTNGVQTAKKGGPLDGNGGQLSVAAVMRSAKDAGVYSVSATNACGGAGGVSFRAYYGNIDNLSIKSWGANAVSFGWSSCGPSSDVKYEYAVSQQPTPAAAEALNEFVTTFDTSASVAGLTSGVTYYIHVRVNEVFLNGNVLNPVFIYDYAPANSCTSLPYQTIRFVACAGNTQTLGSITPLNAVMCRFGSVQLTASGGSSYQWYDGNNNLLTGQTLPAYYASAPGQYRTYITTSGGCQGLAYSATVIDTVLRTANFFGRGVYCMGDTVRLGLSNTNAGQTYIIRKDGQDVVTLTGIGHPNEAGSPDTMWYKFKIISATQTGTYSISTTVPSCGELNFGNINVSTFSGPLTGLNVYDVSDNSAVFNWNLQGTGEAYYEWGYSATPTPPASAAGSFNFVPVLFAPLAPSTQYYFHFRPACPQPNPFSWASIGFTTLATVPVNCASPVTIQSYTPVMTTIASGYGSWDFTGTYPYNSTGVATPGKELIYSFTPDTTGVYYIDVTSSSGGSVSYLYKRAYDGCSNTGWTGIRAVSAIGKYPVGMLQKGVQYLFVLDKSDLSSITQTFKICRATVNTPSATNSCVFNDPIPYTIPAYSQKEEYFIDNAGNLLVAIDFSQMSVSQTGVYISYDVNDNSIRRDIFNKEYLDRSFSIIPGYNSNNENIGVKLFFTNAELLRLINEPDDGIADVASIGDLNVSVIDPYSNGTCNSVSPTAVSYGTRQQSSNGAYDQNSGYISFSSICNASSYFLHGGKVDLNYKLTLNAFEDFDSTLLPKAWKQQAVSGAANLSFPVSSVNPVTTAFGGTRFVWWNSYNLSAGTETRLISAPISTTGSSSVTTEFFWYNNNNALYSTGAYLNEGVQLEYSLDGTNWINTGPFIPRHDGSLASGTGQWVKKKITLPAAAGNQNFIYISFKFHSEFGDNCSLDAVSFIKTPDCNLLVNGLTVTGITSSSATYNWAPLSGVTSYTNMTSTSAEPPVSGSILNVTSVTWVGLQVSTNYFVHVRPSCAGGLYGSWTTVPFTTLAGVPDCNNATRIFPDIPVTATIPAGAGIWNFSGTYPNNSDGYPTPGREQFYTFIPSTTGVYYLEVTSASGWLDYFYKPSGAGCSNTGWTGIDDIFILPLKRAVGWLTAGTTYYIMLDNESTNSVTHTFKISKATVAPPSVLDNCIDAVYLAGPIPANSSKEEFVLDKAGNVIASLNFSGVSNAVGYVNMSYYVNSGAVRRDAGNREYLDRNFTIKTDNAPANPVGIKLFFTNLDMQRLINLPDDGVSDPTSIADIKVSRIQQDCAGSTYQGVSSLLSQTGNASYDLNSSYIQFSTPGFSTFYLHGGSVPLETDNNIVCPLVTTTTFSIPSAGTGYTYRWQADPGTGFQDISNNSTYSGALTTTLTLTNPTTSLNGYKYRCVATNGSNVVISGGRALKFIVTWNGQTSTGWNITSNWDCGVVPDANTDVIIGSYVNPPVVSTNVSCRSIIAKPGTTVTVATGAKLTITGK